MATAPAVGALTVVTVTTTDDGGAGSLREAFATADASSPDAVEIVLTTGAEYVLDDCGEGALSHTASNALTVTGNGSTVRQTCAGERVITNVGSAGHLTVSGVTITGGNVGDLTAGGGIGATSDGLTILNSTITGNSAGSGGAVFVTGGGDVTVVNSTITANVATSDTGGGGIEAQGDATLVYATVVGNTAGGTDEPANVRTGGDLVSFGSVLATPLGTDALNCIVTGSTTSQGYNFSDDASCDLTGVGDTQNGGDPALGPLADNGGGTPTMVPEIFGPLVDKIPLEACHVDGITADQRGLPRPGESITSCGGTPVFLHCDIGAVEDQYSLQAQCAVAPPLVIPPAFTG
ncbi:MAG TPA: right-handed parallel beta-helix repeat-containing protein [Acidimicrobiia bacterium]|nr:right-handed parallel beta-helix repeat-containing protein [Acidimicrobiia bacterium]